MRDDVEKKQMDWGDKKQFNPLRDIQHFAEPPKWNSQTSNGTAKSEMDQSMSGLTSSSDIESTLIFGAKAVC